MSDFISNLLIKNNSINSRIITSSRLLILVLLYYFKDGIQYRELKSSLKITDGKLISDLRVLTSMNYIKKEIIKMNNKELDLYSITEEGYNEVKKIKEWITDINIIIKNEV